MAAQRCRPARPACLPACLTLPASDTTQSFSAAPGIPGGNAKSTCVKEKKNKTKVTFRSYNSQTNDLLLWQTTLVRSGEDRPNVSLGECFTTSSEKTLVAACSLTPRTAETQGIRPQGHPSRRTFCHFGHINLFCVELISSKVGLC